MLYHSCLPCVHYIFFYFEFTPCEFTPYVCIYMLILIFFNKRAETVVSERHPPKGGCARQAGAGLQLTITLDTVYLARRISVKIYNDGCWETWKFGNS